jgi:hypothetical protein
LCEFATVSAPAGRSDDFDVFPSDAGSFQQPIHDLTRVEAVFKGACDETAGDAVFIQHNRRRAYGAYVNSGRNHVWLTPYHLDEGFDIVALRFLLG